MNLVVLALVISGALAGNIVEEIEAEPELSNFLEMVEKAGFLDVLKSEGPFSVIAPMNSGFRLVHLCQSSDHTFFSLGSCFPLSLPAWPMTQPSTER